MTERLAVTLVKLSDYPQCIFCGVRTHPIIEFKRQESNSLVVSMCMNCLAELYQKAENLVSREETLKSLEKAHRPTPRAIPKCPIHGPMVPGKWRFVCPSPGCVNTAEFNVT